MKDAFATKYNEVVSEKKMLEDKVIELAGKFFLRTPGFFFLLRLRFLLS